MPIKSTVSFPSSRHAAPSGLKIDSPQGQFREPEVTHAEGAILTQPRSTSAAPSVPTSVRQVAPQQLL